MARLLVDTHVFLWWVDDAPDLSPTARRMIADAKNECYLSMASCWEMAIKSSLGKLRFSKPVGHFVSEQLTINGFLLLPIELRHVAKIEKLPPHHRDPFDRLMIAQAVSEKMTIVTADGIFPKYDVKVVH